jgi:hypothetical protein
MWSTVALVAGAGAVTVVLAQAPVPADGGHHESPATPVGGPATLAPDPQQMMKMMAADDEKLAALIASLNAATGEQKVAAIAAVVTELAAQRTRMQMQMQTQMQMMRMQSGMMDQMRSHMAAMHGAGGMMNKKAPAPTPGADEQDHAAHHPEK